jgi:HKD family nuclease
LHQRAGIDPVANEVKVALSGKYTSLRILVAYISWDGLSLFRSELEAFVDSGKTARFVVGIGQGRSEPAALRYLLERLPRDCCRVFHLGTPYYTFHPKLFMFDAGDERLVILGSSNATMGGLHNNSEVGVRLELARPADSEMFARFDDIWDTYSKPLSPFPAGSCRKLTGSWLARYERVAPRTDAATRRISSARLGFPTLAFGVPRAKRYSRRTGQVKRTRRTPGATLVLEILNETGAGGTQVQIPARVVEEFLMAPTTGHQTLELVFPPYPPRPAVLCHFPNNTHRVTLPEVASKPRPLIIEMLADPGHPGRYQCRLRQGARYSAALRKCTNQTRAGAKHWVVY